MNLSAFYDNLMCFENDAIIMQLWIMMRLLWNAGTAKDDFNCIKVIN